MLLLMPDLGEPDDPWLWATPDPSAKQTSAQVDGGKRGHFSESPAQGLLRSFIDG